MAGVRETARARTREAILAAARHQIVEHGGGGLSMRAVAREVGVVSSAVYRYFPTREALLTTMIIDSYQHLDAALGAAQGATPAQRWGALGRALRDWAASYPHEFQLIYGTPMPGYVAPSETIPAAAAVAGHFLAVGAGSAVVGFDDPALVAQMREGVPDHDPSGAAAVIAELTALIGFISAELAGHLVGSADPGDHLYAALLARQARTLGLS